MDDAKHGRVSLVDTLTWVMCLAAMSLVMQTRVQTMYLLAAGALIGFLAEGGVF